MGKEGRAATFVPSARRSSSRICGWGQSHCSEQTPADTLGRRILFLQPLPWLDGLRFGRPGALLFTFERTGTSGPATLLRFDAGIG